jgi:hypothetical protein
MTISAAAASAASSSSSAAAVDDDREDRALVAQRVAKQTAERRRAEEVPFQTRAMREVERLQKARVYSHALIRVQLPDRYLLVSHTFSKHRYCSAVTYKGAACCVSQFVLCVAQQHCLTWCMLLRLWQQCCTAYSQYRTSVARLLHAVYSALQYAANH